MWFYSTHSYRVLSIFVTKLEEKRILFIPVYIWFSSVVHLQSACILYENKTVMALCATDLSLGQYEWLPWMSMNVHEACSHHSPFMATGKETEPLESKWLHQRHTSSKMDLGLKTQSLGSRVCSTHWTIPPLWSTSRAHFARYSGMSALKDSDRAREMAQQLRALTAFPKVLSSNPSNLMGTQNHL